MTNERKTIDMRNLELLTAAMNLLANAEFADGQGTILTHDAEELEKAIANFQLARESNKS